MFLYKPFDENIIIEGNQQNTTKLSKKEQQSIQLLKQDISDRLYQFFSSEKLSKVSFTHVNQQFKDCYDIPENEDVVLERETHFLSDNKQLMNVSERITVKRKNEYLYYHSQQNMFKVKLHTYPNEEEFEKYEMENGKLFLNSKRMIIIKDTQQENVSRLSFIGNSNNNENDIKMMSIPIRTIFKLSIANNILTIQLNPFYYFGPNDTFTVKLKTNDINNLYCTLNHYRYNKKFGYECGMHFKLQIDSSIDIEYRPSLTFNPGNIELFSKSELNMNYGLCPTYGKELYFPSTCTESDIQGCAKHRSKQRLPILTYYHHQTNSCIYRCSQPLVGSYGTILQFIWDYQSQEDQRFIKAIRTDGKSEDAEMAIFDCRDSLASYGNRLAGKGGTESAYSYPNCEIVFLAIPNIHVVREAYYTYRSTFVEFQSKKITSLNTVRERGKQWYELLNLIKQKAIDVYNYFKKGKNILIHCSDGWDRTAQLSSLVKVMISEKYRTITGFIDLIQHDWISAGHKFQDRLHSFEEENSPVFHQFLEIVYTLMMNNPFNFEFNEDLLVDILAEACCPTTVTFIRNNNKDRDENKTTKYESFFSSIVSNIQKYVNKHFDPSQEMEFGDYDQIPYFIWSKYYLRNTDIIFE